MQRKNPKKQRKNKIKQRKNKIKQRKNDTESRFIHTTLDTESMTLATVRPPLFPTTNLQAG